MTLRERIARAMYCTKNRADQMDYALEPAKIREVYLTCADAVLAEIEAAGMILVPREPTEAQLKLCYDWASSANHVKINERFYRAMLSAAPAGGE